ncbi:MAG: glycoside hydrolase family 2 protein [Syntrophales bacterium]|nr:glycoside hydrolase family 2 protein [Syntrophales bacterium]
MKTINLNGKWMLLGSEPQSDSLDNIIKPDPNIGDWMITNVPGDVNATLLQYKKIPDPHYDTQAQNCYWVTGKEWWYKLTFDTPDVGEAKTDLCLTGVDGHADIWLNDKYLGEMKNAFRLFRFNVTGLLKPEGNALLLRFQSLNQLLGGPRFDEQNSWKDRRAFLRKPQFSFGWDWALPLPSIGLSENVWIEHHNEYCLTDISIQPFMNGRIDFAFEVTEKTKEAGYRIAVNVTGYGSDIKNEISRDSFKSYLSLSIPNPQLWFPNGYGKHPLYDYSIELLVNDVVADRRKGRLGLRESKIVERPFTPTKAGPGFSFGIEINGETIFCKGANWVPLELWPVNASEEQYEFYLKKAKEANFNMLRVWGGGIYERDIFYELCDELGIMVWQDFMFASTGYPIDLLRDEIMAEANYQIRRLRNHPSIVLWCGCNEDVYSWDYPNQAGDNLQKDSGIYSETKDAWTVNRLRDDPQIYTMILRGLVGGFGLGVPYVESSPQSRDDFGNLPNSGNCHISCWKYALFESDGKPERFRNHFERVCSFNSEFCIQGPCSEKTFKKFLSPDNLWPPNQAWIDHIQRGHRNLPHYEQTLLIAGAIFGEIDSLQKYVKFGQATHAEMMRAEFESARRDRPNNGGTMVWMYNDSWPTSNWSIIDYYRHPKPAFYAAKRACATLLPIIFERSGKIEFFFSNDSFEGAEVNLTYGQETLQGSWKEIPWPYPQIKFEFLDQEFARGKWHSRIQLQTDSFARFCHLLVKKDNIEISLSDNYFDVSAGSKHQICIQSQEKLDANSLTIGNWWTKWE